MITVVPPTARPTGRRDRRAALGDRQPAVAVERASASSGSLGIAARGRCTGPASSTSTSSPASARTVGGDRAAGAGADDRRRRSPRRRPAGSRSPSGARGAGRRARPSAPSQRGLVADRRADPRVVAVPESGEDLQEAAAGRACAAEARSSMRAESPGAPRGSRARSATGTAATRTPAGRAGRRSTRARAAAPRAAARASATDVDAARRRLRPARPAAAARRPGAIASANARRIRSSAALSPGARLQDGAAGLADPAGERPEQQRDADQEAVDEEVEQVGEDVVVEQVEAERGRATRRPCRRRAPAAAAGSGRRRSRRPGRSR